MPVMIGESPAMLEVFETIKHLSSTDANILILGENGTGKDLVAHALHAGSPRNAASFLIIR